MSEGKQYCELEGKRIFDKKGAVSMRNIMLRDHGVAMREYHCPACNGWHMSTKDRERNKLHKGRKQPKDSYASITRSEELDLQEDR